jgi:hypothetical protein
MTTKSNVLLNETVDGMGNDYTLYFDIKDSSLPDYVDIKFYSKFSSAKDPNASQVKWQTTLPLEAIDTLSDTLIDYLRTKVMEKV